MGPEAGMDEGSKKRPSIELEDVEVHHGTLLFRISYTEQLDPLIASGLFYAKYDFEVEDVPTSVLSVPLLGFLAPLGWLTGADVKVGKVDASYLKALSSVLSEYRQMYRWLPPAGALTATPVESPGGMDPSKFCVLYSGGVDSTCSLIRSIEKRPSALTVWGSPDLPLQDQRYWERVRDATQSFLGPLGVDSHVVTTNALGMVRQDAIRSRFKNKLRAGWWEELAFGLFYLSIAAPYTYHGRVGNVLIGSSNTVNDQVPWGSTPMTDEKVTWGGVKVFHDSYDLTRTAKIRQVILPYAATRGGHLPLRVCIGRKSERSEGGHLNCGACPKCMVVGLTLVLSGADASGFGFDFSPPILSRLRRNLENGEFGREYDPASWDFIKEKAHSPPAEQLEGHDGLRSFLEWFAEWDGRSRNRRRFIDRVAPPGTRRRDLARAGFARKGEGRP